ncbi:uncharacterized protein LOC133822222 [Humulus lupulus]|uniref:uncharacterized protein LOC133822222 n=1 Tax=Humulus lupulus TaxID=3486 RepID=UPI002B410B9B|nr:uncharacterized protein LOC133822222 [Humulus lupulus]
MIKEKIENHPFHPNHSLILTDDHNMERCSTCSRTSFSSHVYQCEEYPECKFRLCRECSSVEPNIDYPGHQHKLCFMEKTEEEDVECDADDGYCKRDFVCDELDRTAYSSILRCVPCNFNIVHLLCGPLPRSIRYEYHMHPLVLTPSVIDSDNNHHESQDEDDEYYCDICEDTRDERICVYYCADCKFVAHVHCLIPQITSALTGSVEDQDLILLSTSSGSDDTDDQVDKNDMTLMDLIQNLTKEDKETFEEHFYWHTSNNVVFDSTCGESHGRQPEKYIFPHSPADLDNQVYKFDTYCNFRRLKLDTNDLEVKVVTVKNYKVAWYLRNVLKSLLEKHGDVIDEESKLSGDMKSLAFHFLCRVIYDKDRTRRRDITEELIREWYGYLKFVRRMGLRIMFLYEQLEKIKRDFVSQIPIRLESEIPNELHQKKSRLQKQIEKVDTDLDKCKEYSSRSSGVRLRLSDYSYGDDEASKLMQGTAEKNA